MIFEGRKIEAAIFDMDGTMFDTERLRIEMLKAASEAIYGESLPDEILIDSLGLSAKAAEELAKKRYGGDYPYQEIRARADEMETQHVKKNGVPIQDGLIDVLERLKKNELLLAVATSSKRSITEEYLLRADVLKYFDIVVCGDEIKRGKPSPDIFLKAINELSCDPSCCLIFEDSQNGLIAAADSGALPIFIKDIKEPAPAVKIRSFKAYDAMVDFLDELIKITVKMPKPKLNEHFPQSLGHAKAGIHGFGAIGGGYLSQIFSHWDGYTRPAQIIGAARSRSLRELINSFGKFSVQYESVAYVQTIKNVHIIDIADEREMIRMYKECEVIGLSLPESTIKSQAELIAKGLLERYESGGKDLTILVVLNKIKGGRFVRECVEAAAIKIAGIEKAQMVIGRTHFTETVVNRMVSKIPKDALLKKTRNDLNALQKSLDDKNINKSPFLETNRNQSQKHAKAEKKSPGSKEEKLFDAASVLRNISRLEDELSSMKITIFNSEPDMPLYASGDSPILKRLRQVEIVDDIGKIGVIKNRLSNATHAIIAWYSSLLGYKTIGQGMGDERVLSLASKVMKNEIKPLLLVDSPDYAQYINTFIVNFIRRCRSSFQDPCVRVGRDPMRKLQKNERIFGTVLAAQKHNIPTPLLEFGVAAGLLYAVSGVNPDDKEGLKIKEIYDKNKSISDVLTYCGPYNAKPYKSLSIAQDAALIARIETCFTALSKDCEITLS